MADVITHSQRVIPEATLASGFKFLYADIYSALAQLNVSR